MKKYLFLFIGLVSFFTFQKVNASTYLSNNNSSSLINIKYGTQQYIRLGQYNGSTTNLWSVNDIDSVNDPWFLIKRNGTQNCAEYYYIFNEYTDSNYSQNLNIISQWMNETEPTGYDTIQSPYQGRRMNRSGYNPVITNGRYYELQLGCSDAGASSDTWFYVASTSTLTGYFALSDSYDEAVAVLAGQEFIPSENISFIFPVPSTTLPWFNYYVLQGNNFETSSNRYFLTLDIQDLNHPEQHWGPYTQYMWDHTISDPKIFVPQLTNFPGLNSDNNFYSRATLYKNFSLETGFISYVPVLIATTTFHVSMSSSLPNVTSSISSTIRFSSSTNNFLDFLRSTTTPIIASSTNPGICGNPSNNWIDLAWAGCKIIEFGFIPGKYLQGPAYFMDQAQSFKNVAPFTFFFSTMDDVRTVLASSVVSTTLAVQVPMPGSVSPTSTNITIASPTFGRDQAGEHIWAAYTNMFILFTGASSIIGIIAFIFFL